MEDIKWYEADDNENGIEIIGFADIDKKLNVGRIVGYNNIIVGDKVIYKGREYTVVMASRMGDFGLSLTGELPYEIRVEPKEVKKV